MMADDYRIEIAVPSVPDYRRLRAVAELTPRSAATANAGLLRTVVGAVVRHGDTAVGMGRAVGDGLFYQMIDMAWSRRTRAAGSAGESWRR